MPEITTFNAKGFDIGNKKHGQVKILCPFCNEKRTNKRDKSLSVNIDDGVYKCHYCNAKGNIHEFKLYTQPKVVYTRPPQQSELDINQKAVEWFNGRSISLATLKKAKITTGIEWMPQSEKEMSVIRFNYFRDGELVNIKYRDAKKDFKLFKDAELIFYNIDSIRDTEKVIITEGEIDCLSYIESGIDYVISVPNGASVGKMQYIDNCIEYLLNKTSIYLAVDQDTSGLNLRSELLTRFGSEKCFKVDYKDCKDANEYLIKYGTEKLKETITNAEPFPIDGIVKLKDYYEEFRELYLNGNQRGILLNTSLDDFITWEFGKLLVVTGIPTHGKGVVVDNICAKFAVKYGYKTNYFSPENYPLKIHFQTIAEILTGKTLQSLSEYEFENVCKFINEHYSFIKPDEDNFTLDDILEKAKKDVFLSGIRIVVIDPWNRLDHSLNGESETNYISKSLTKMSMFAQTNDALVILVAHPTKMRRIKDSVKFEEPTLYDISGSAHFYNKCDYGLVVYRDFQDSYMKLSIQKVKFRYLGNVGSLNQKFNVNNNRLTDYDLDTVTWDNSNWLLPSTVENIKMFDDSQPPY